MESMNKAWTASWIWTPGEIAPADSYTYFRAVVHLDDVTDDLMLQLSADLRYRLWVNEQLIGDGPPPSVPQSVYYDSHPVHHLLRPGANCIAVVVRCTGQEWDRRAGLLAELTGESDVFAATGMHPWRCRRADAWTSGTAQSPMNHYDPYQEIFDAQCEPVGWRRADFNDAEWDEAQVVGAAGTPTINGQWQTLTARPIPAMEESPLQPVSVVAEECLSIATRTRKDLSIGLSQAGRPITTTRVDGLQNLVRAEGVTTMAPSEIRESDPMVDGVYEPCLLLDFGRQITAYLELDVSGPAGAVLDLGIAERLVDGHFNNALEGQFASRYTLVEGRQQWRSFAWRGFRYVRVRLAQGKGQVVLHAVRGAGTRYPFDELGRFQAPDEPRWDRIVEMCRHTVRLCCHESIMDTPWREQAQWLGDVAAVTAPAIRTLFGDSALVEKYFRQAAGTIDPGGTMAVISNGAPPPKTRPARDIPDYTLWWVIDLLEHYRYTGNRELLEELYPVVRQVVEGMASRLTSVGTLPSFGWVFIDWAAVDKEGECAALNAILYGALRSAAELAAVLNATDDHDRWCTLADTLQAHFASRFWSPEASAFVDARHDDGELSRDISEHANFAAIRFGLIAGPEAESLAERILDDPAVTEAQPYFCSVVLDGLCRTDRRDLALDLVEARWGRRMLDRGATSCFEEWGINGSWRSGTYAGFMRTQSHAWGAHPATFMIKDLAGIRILTPGCRRLRVDPYRGMDFRVDFPTPLGVVNVDVRGGFARVAAPDGVQVEAGHQTVSVVGGGSSAS